MKSITKEEITIIEKEYFKDLQEIKETIRINQNKAMVIVNAAMIMTYYAIGSIINQRKQWRNKYIERLANDLKEYGKGYSKRTLYYINRFYEEFTRDEIVQHPVAQISWRSIILIMSKYKDHIKALWYIEEAYKNGWGNFNFKQIYLLQIGSWIPFL